MPKRRMMDYLMRGSGSKRMKMDRGADYGHYGVRGSEHYPMDGNYPHSEYPDERSRQNYESMGQSDMGYNSIDMRRRRNARGQYMSDRAYENQDYGFHEERGFKPVEAMGYFTGYYGGGDYGRRDYGDYDYDMRYDMRGRGGRDYGYDYAGDYGEKLTKQEMEHWRKKLDNEVGDEQSKHFFKKENIEQRAKQLGIEMKHFDAEELAIAGYMLYSDYCKSLKPYVGSNMDVFIKMGEEFLNDPDSEVKGGEKLALYFDMVSGD